MTDPTPHDLRDQVIELRVEMRQMRETMAKVASALDKLATLEATSLTLHKELNDHEGRIRTLEHGFWKAIGIATGISAIVGWFSTKFWG